uniref:Uncharacterized protein n=1 Tax=Alexandrium catenella TaxID=2925 RepID=A0A7S1MLL4_ALECA
MEEGAPHRPQQPIWPAPKQPALSAKEDLRGVHWATGFRSLPSSKSETRSQYIPHENVATPTEVPSHLRQSHWDLAFGSEKTGREWQSVLTEQMSSNLESKFGCSKPEGMKGIASELRRSSIALSCGNLVAYQSEQHSRYQPNNGRPAESYSDLLGKDLRASHIDIANGQDKSTRTWRGVNKGDMSQHAREKYQCEKPRGFEELSKELRKSSVPLGGLNTFTSNRR